jgi:SAM-dependent methyltransferase
MFSLKNLFSKKEEKELQLIDTPLSREETRMLSDEEFREIFVNKIPEIDLSEERPEYLLHSPEVVGWLTIEEQRLLFSALTFLYNSGDSVLDIGCGRGDLYGFLQEKYPGTEIKYKGIDINPNIINIAKEKYSGIHVENIHILDDKSEDTFDWVMASGVFNLKDYFELEGIVDSEDILDYTKECIDDMYDKANVGVAFNLLTSIPDDINDDDKNALVVHDVSYWLKYLIDVYNSVIVRADYLNGDVTFFILK